MFIFNVNLGSNHANTPRTKQGELKLALTMLTGTKKLSKLIEWIGPEQARIANLQDGQQYWATNIKLVDVTTADGTVLQQAEFEGLMHLGNAGALSFPIISGLAAMGFKVPQGGFAGWEVLNTSQSNTPDADETMSEAEAKAAFDAMPAGPKKAAVKKAVESGLTYAEAMA